MTAATVSFRKEAAAVSNEEIVEKIQKGIEVEANQERLWNKNRGFVALCIKKYAGNCHEQDFEDFLHEGFIGLMAAARKYKASHGAKFLTYAGYHVRNALYCYKGQNTYTVRVPEYLKAEMRKLAAFQKEYWEEHKKNPTSEEMQEFLGINAIALRHLEKTMMNMHAMSLDAYVSEDGDASLLDLLSSDEKIDDLVCGSVYMRELHQALEDALSILDSRTAMMIRCVFYQRRGYRGTAGIFKCSSQAVHERINRGFFMILRSKKHRENLESFMWEGYHVNPRRLSTWICKYSDRQDGDVDMGEIDGIDSELLL